MPPRLHRAFGLWLRAHVTLPGMPEVAVAGRPLVDVRIGDATARWSGAAGEPVWTTTIDGAPYRMEAGAAGDHLLTHEGRTAFHLAADGSALVCDPVEPDKLAWQRFLLDTVLWTTSLLHGFELLHAAAVTWGGRAVAIAAGTGGGKSSLAAELVERGGRLVSDDIVALRVAGGEVLAQPGPPVMNLDAAAAGRPRLGRVLGRLGDEDWIAVERHARRPSPLGAICVLERRPGHALAAERLPGTALDLLPHGLGFDHLEGRRRHQFELLSAVAVRVPILRLRAPLDASPAQLADALEQALAPDASRTTSTRTG